MAPRRSEAAEIAVLAEKVESLETQISELRNEVKALTNTANRWKGGFALLFILGGLLGWASTFLSEIWKFIHVTS